MFFKLVLLNNLGILVLLNLIECFLPFSNNNFKFCENLAKIRGEISGKMIGKLLQSFKE